MQKFRMTEFPSEHQSYTHAKQRCRMPTDAAFKYYGAKGIEFRFVSFQEFMEEVGPKPTRKHTIDRINVRGHYEIGNVRWLTLADQQKNKTNTILFTYEEKTQCLADWAKEIGMTKQGITRRYRAGWCVPCILTVPSGPSSGRWERHCPHTVLVSDRAFA